jgi:hypothetical protein
VDLNRHTALGEPTSRNRERGEDAPEGALLRVFRASPRPDAETAEYGWTVVVFSNGPVSGAAYFAVTDLCRAPGIEHVNTVVTRLREEAEATANKNTTPDVGGGTTTTLPIVVVNINTWTRTGIQPLVNTNEPEPKARRGCA